MKVSIVIVNYNTRELLHACLESVYRHTSGIDFEVIVVDNASADGSADMVRTGFPLVTLVASPVNLGFGGANNLGASNATGEYLFLLNSDTLLIDNAILPLVEFMDSNGDCGICGGNLVDLEREPTHCYGPVLPSPWSDLHRFVKGSMRIRYGKNWCYNHTGKPRKVGYITGADLLIRKEIFDRLNGFDPVFFMYYEETELTDRVRKDGWTVWSVPRATIIHIKGASLEFLDGAKKMVFESKYRYLRKVYGERGARIAHGIFMLYCLYKRTAFALLGKTEKQLLYAQMGTMDSDTYLAENGNS